MTDKIDYKKLLKEKERIDIILDEKCHPFISRFARKKFDYKSAYIKDDFVVIEGRDNLDGLWTLDIPFRIFVLENGVEEFGKYLEEEFKRKQNEEKQRKAEENKRKNFLKAKKTYFKYKDEFEDE